LNKLGSDLSHREKNGLGEHKKDEKKNKNEEWKQGTWFILEFHVFPPTTHYLLWFISESK